MTILCQARSLEEILGVSKGLTPVVCPGCENPDGSKSGQVRADGTWIPDGHVLSGKQSEPLSRPSTPATTAELKKETGISVHVNR